MELTIPKTSAAMSVLLKADFTTQWRNRRSFILVLFIPVMILFSFKNIGKGGAFILSTGVTIGLVAIGLMGYCNSIARDRDKGVFQRLRVAPIPGWCIMASRLTVQVVMILLLTLVVFFAGNNIDHIALSPLGYFLGFLAALAGAAVYLGLGQLIVGLIQNPETVNSTSRLVYFLFIVVGLFGEGGALGQEAQQIILWSPYGTVKRVIAAGMQPSTWDTDTTAALLLTVGYALIFGFIGIRQFKWSNK
jgi:ABC-2 type transport system permease protein